jgi:hypothetical protein
VKRDARLVLPGDLVKVGDSSDRLLTVHHVEIVPTTGGTQVIVCFASGPHPDREVLQGAQWPTIAVAPGEKVDVLPAKPKVTTTWDETKGKWKVDVVEEPETPA